MSKRHITIILLLSTVMLISFSCGRSKSDGPIEDKKSGLRIIETGELAAVETQSFVLPSLGYWWRMKIIGIQKHGAEVKAGDSIIQIDPSEIKKFIIDRETDYETQKAVLEKLHVNQENKRQEWDSRMKNELAAFEQKKLELEASRFESDRIRKVKELEFKQAQIGLAKVKRMMALGKIIDANELKVEQIKTRQLKDNIKNAYAMLPLCTIRTPISGIFQIAINRQTDEMVKLGDDVFRGNSLGNVPDLTWMKVNTSIGERDFLKIKQGQKVTVRLDALPKVPFKGEILYVGKLCHEKNNKSREKVFDVEVKLLQSDTRLKPGMTVSCEFL